MKVIKSLLPVMCMLQTILLENTLTSANTDWDLAALKLCIIADECQARSAGETLGTKLDVPQPNALAVEGGSRKMKCCDPNDPTWLL